MADLTPVAERYAELRELRKVTTHLVKAAIGALATDTPGVAYDGQRLPIFANLIRRRTLLGRMRAGVRHVPARTQVTGVSASGSAAFVPESNPIPVSKPELLSGFVTPSRVATIMVHTRELAKASFDKSANLIERDAARALGIAEDAALLDGLPAVVGGRPASLLAGKSPLGSGSPSDIEEDVRVLAATVRGGSDAVQPYFITSFSGARFLLTARHATNNEKLFPAVTLTGGQIWGVDLLVSSGTPDNILALVDSDAVLVTDDDDARLAISTEASLQFDTEPSAGPQNMVSLLQSNSIAVKAVRFIGWELLWPDGAEYITLPVGSPA